MKVRREGRKTKDDERREEKRKVRGGERGSLSSEKSLQVLLPLCDHARFLG